MQITLIPQRRDDRLTLMREGETLILCGQPLDLSAAAPGAPIPQAASPWLASDVTRDEGGALRLALFLPHGPEAPQATLYPAPLHPAADGAVALPSWGPEPDA